MIKDYVSNDELGAARAEATLNGGEAERETLGQICEKYRKPLQTMR